MTPAERVKYFRDMWPAACAVKGWRKGDNERRRAVALECMREVRGPLVTTSDARFGRDETTALFCYLDLLAHPADLDRAARWVDCCTDYHAYNRARQADYYESKAYGAAGSKRLRKQRFAGRQSATGEALDAFDPAAIKQRFVTMASRAQRKERRERAAAPVQDPDTAMPTHEPDPAYITPVGQPF